MRIPKTHLEDKDNRGYRQKEATQQHEQDSQKDRTMIRLQQDKDAEYQKR